MFIIVGLGNPGPEYETTRHNIGFLTVDLLAEKYAIELSELSFQALWSEGKVKKKQVVLAKPVTFVNSSGDSVKALVDSFKVNSTDLLVIHDDLDLPFGEVRVKVEGGSGGHNGLKSIIGKLEDDNFIRIRVGIGQPPGKLNPADFVLGPFPDKEWEEVQFVMIKAVDAVVSVVTEGVDEAMKEFNRSKK